MKKILLLGAGRSASSLIRYLFEQSVAQKWQITIADASVALVQEKIKNMAGIQTVGFDINEHATAKALIADADLVISLLPAAIHIKAAEICLQENKNLITASYVSPEMAALGEQAAAKNLIFLNECGLDPGIDHMSAMQIIDKIRKDGGEITSFKSFCGGLVAPESDNNPWGYKFTWNPRNVILAGQGTVKYLLEGRYKYLPYHRLFGSSETIEVDGYGHFDAYANRDSLSYRSVYGLENIPTILRGTLRKHGFCNAWNVLVQLGITDDSYLIENTKSLTYAEFISGYLPHKSAHTSLAVHLNNALHQIADSETIRKIKWLGLFDETPIGLDKPSSPAQILQHLLEQKWKLEAGDKDMVVMQHQFEYVLDGKHHRLHSSLVSIGQDETYTAMANTVGLPLGIAAKLILQGKISQRGVLVPVTPEFYEPILAELATFGLTFTEKYL